MKYSLLTSDGIPFEVHIANDPPPYVCTIHYFHENIFDESKVLDYIYGRSDIIIARFDDASMMVYVEPLTEHIGRYLFKYHKEIFEHLAQMIQHNKPFLPLKN